MIWLILLQSTHKIFVLMLAGIGLAGIPGDLQAWWKWLSMLDECGMRIAFGFLAVLVLVGPDYYRRFKNWRNQKIRHKHRERLLYIDASAIVDSYIRDAIKDEPDRIKLYIRHSILDTFEETCPEGMKGEHVYDGDTLEHWIQSNAIRMLVAHYGQLKLDNQENQ